MKGVPAMDIYSILSSKPHNPHYLNRYITFVQKCQQKNVDYYGYVEKHHICPKAKDMFPEYKSLSKHVWNKAELTPRQHFISHIILWKTFPNTSQEDALWAMKHKNGQDINSRLYESLRIDIRKKNIHRARSLSDNGLHPWQGDKNPSRRKVKEGIHIFLGDDHPMKIKSREGTHPWLGPETNAKYAKENARKRVESGSASRAAKITNKKRVENGTHHWLGPESNKKRIQEGSHNLLGIVPCVDRNGKRLNIPKDVYNSQNGDKDSWEFVHFNSFEGKRRKTTS
jgi:hypothetical protein